MILESVFLIRRIGLVFGAIDIVYVHANQKSDDGTCGSGRYQSKNGCDDGKLEFHATKLGLEKV